MTASETVAIVGRNILRPRQRPVVDVPQVLEVERFVEKPPKPAAAAMLAAGEHFWNSGMFVFRADRILAELARHAPAIERAVEAAFAALGQAPGDGWQVPLDLY